VRIPESGKKQDQVLGELERFRADDVDGSLGRTFCNIFLASREGRKVAEEACRMYLWENGLDPTLYPSLVKLENEIVAMAAAHLGGDGNVTGNFTSGGTESVLLAVKTARDRAHALRPEADPPEMVLPETAHPCFYKAAQYFRVKPVVVPVDPRTFKAEPAAMQRAISPRTVLLAASAPSYAHGVLDPVPEIGRIARENDLLFHVDGCIGAFLLPYFRELGARVTDFDFRVPGVTSISMDFHKYAFAPKGASVILYRNAEIRRHQIFSWSGWPGYTLVNQTMQSSKSGGPLAGTWAVLNYFGQDGYREQARRLKEASERIVAGVDALEEVRVLGRPEMSLIGIGSDTLSVFRICDEMKKLGWDMYPQTRHGSLRESFHLTVVPGNVERIDEWLRDLERCVKGLKSRSLDPEAGGLRGLIAGIDFEKLTDPEIEQLLEAAGLAGGSLPREGTAEINEVLNELPPAVADRILTLYFNQIFRYRPDPDGGG